MRTDRSEPSRSWIAGGLALAVSVLTGCAVVEGVARNLGASEKEAALIAGGTGAAATKMTAIGWEEEYEYGGAIATMIVATYGGIYKDPELERYVNLVGWTVANYSTRPEIRYNFGILDTDEIQAMAAPAGFVFITRGLIAALDDEAQLAAVLAHEVAHVANKDTLGIIKNLKAKEQLADAAGDAWKGAKAFSGVVDGFLDDFLANGLPKDLELTADVDAAATLSRTGYDPLAMREALARIETRIHAKHGDDHAGDEEAFNRTHPSFADRFARLDRALAELPEGGKRLQQRFAKRTAGLHRKDR